MGIQGPSRQPGAPVPGADLGIHRGTAEISNLVDVAPLVARACWRISKCKGGTMFFKRGVSEDDAWEGVVAGKKRSSPDGQNIHHKITVTLGDGTTKEIRVRGGLWKSVNVGDRLVKRPGEKAPAKAA
jgi:hypothetical protein